MIKKIKSVVTEFFLSFFLVLVMKYFAEWIFPDIKFTSAHLSTMTVSVFMYLQRFPISKYVLGKKTQE